MTPHARCRPRPAPRRGALAYAFIAGCTLATSGCTRAQLYRTGELPPAAETLAPPWIVEATTADGALRAPPSPRRLSPAEATARTLSLTGGAILVGAATGLSCGPFAAFCSAFFGAAFGAAGLVTGTVSSIVEYRSETTIAQADQGFSAFLDSLGLDACIADALATRAPGIALPRGAPPAEAATLVLTVVDVSFVPTGRSSYNPSLRLSIAVRGSLRIPEAEPPAHRGGQRASRGRPAPPEQPPSDTPRPPDYVHWQWTSAPHSYFSWGGSRDLLDREFAVGLGAIVGRIASDLGVPAGLANGTPLRCAAPAS